jgi:hypothetical protein
MSGDQGSGAASASSFLAVLIEDALAANGIDSTPVEGFPAVMTGTVAGSIGQWNFFAQADDASMGVVVYSVFPGNIAEARRPAVSELATRVNYLLRYGNLEMDFADGEVRARTSARGGNDPLDFTVISQLVKANLELAELFFPAVREVAGNEAPPAKALSGLLQRIQQT